MYDQAEGVDWLARNFHCLREDWVKFNLHLPYSTIARPAAEPRPIQQLL
ncbi:hypothetical protein M8C21_003299, partial [Ambrosia artemisiifolia]